MNVLIWGTGKIADRIIKNKINANIIGFLQTKKDCSSFKGYEVFEFNKITTPYDFIIVANSFTDEIFQLCVDNNIDLDKIIFIKKGTCTKFNHEKKIRDILGEDNYSLYQSSYGITKDSFFEHDMALYSKLNKRKNFEIQENFLYPILSDKYSDAGNVHSYFLFDLWAAKLIIDSGEKQHFDIGSRLDGFIAHLLAARIDVTMIDVRPFPVPIEGLTTIVDDATSLRQIPDNSITSMSALSSLEHFGLGRFGDPVDPEACFKCFENIQKKLARKGHFYLSVPIGQERVEFNAHRIFYPSTIIDSFHDCELLEFSVVTDKRIIKDAGIHDYDKAVYFDGIFHFVKR